MTLENQKCCKITVTGKVQGIFFRKYAKTAANLYGIKGLVRNEADGSVYIEAAGDKEQVDKFIKWCNRGPINAKVKKVEVTEIPFKKFDDFGIGYL
jgi:acylphosphatase